MQMVIIITPNSSGVFGSILHLSGYACTVNVYTDLGTGFYMSYNFTSTSGYTIYPAVLEFYDSMFYNI